MDKYHGVKDFLKLVNSNPDIREKVVQLTTRALINMAGEMGYTFSTKDYEDYFEALQEHVEEKRFQRENMIRQSVGLQVSVPGGIKA